MDATWTQAPMQGLSGGDGREAPDDGRRLEIAGRLQEWFGVNVSPAGPGKHDIKFPMPKGMNPELAKMFFEEVTAQVFPSLRIVGMEVWYLYEDRNLVSVLVEDPDAS